MLKKVKAFTKKTISAYVILITLAVLSTIFAFVSYYFVLKSSRALDSPKPKQYTYHFAMITESTGSAFWNDVYQGAAEAGEQNDAYVELIGNGLVDQFSVEEFIDMAIYQKVDGILVHPNDGYGVKRMIQKAEDSGIPVITMQKDVPDSGRLGSVSVNYYLLGLEYGDAVNKASDPDTRLIAVLIPQANFDEAGKLQFQSGLTEALNNKAIQCAFNVVLDENGLNNSPEIILPMLQDESHYPDFIICLDPIVTQNVYQMISDSNLIDRVKIMGYYISDDILIGIERGSINASVTFDARLLGKCGAEALVHYKRGGAVGCGEEFSVHVIDRDNVDEYTGGAGHETD